MSQNSFSFSELLGPKWENLEPLQAQKASDGITLSYRTYSPQSAHAVLLFYHGGGAHSGAGYQPLGIGLQRQYNIQVFMPDIRGHGFSGGARGDTPKTGQVWTDISTFIKTIRENYPSLPIFLGGHSSGAGLVLNYASQPMHEPVQGYVFLAPEFGFRSKTARPANTHPFAKVNTAAFVLNGLSGGRLAGHVQAVHLNYPAEVLAADRHIIASYSVNMANAVTPSKPQAQFAALERPFGLWIGAEDELNDPQKVAAFAALTNPLKTHPVTGILPGEKHLSILGKAHESVGAWIVQQTPSF